MKHLFPIGILCLCATHLSAQKTEEPPTKPGIKYNQHKYEIGIDVKSVFSLQGIGSGLIFKKRIGEKKYISVYEKKALRLQFGGSANVPVSAKVESDIAGTEVREENLKNSEGFVFAGIGTEWQKQRDRIQFFYGGDFSVTLATSSIDSYSGVYYLGQGAYENVWNRRRQYISSGVTGFGGIRFFFSPRFSLSVESGIYFGYSFVKSSYTHDFYDLNLIHQEIQHEENVNGFDWSTQFVRALYFSYYF
jgi:hypothetical protein